VAKEMCKTGRFYCNMTVSKTNLQGSGMLVCNPTQDLDTILSDETVHWLAHTMNLGKDEYMVEQIMKKKKIKG
jgi:23S rRNA A2030 N6-methylase RlmJ